MMEKKAINYTDTLSKEEGEYFRKAEQRHFGNLFEGDSWAEKDLKIMRDYFRNNGDSNVEEGKVFLLGIKTITILIAVTGTAGVLLGFMAGFLIGGA